ncbi:MAG: PilZ domain-containing protein [Thermoanaerobaculia bacterium]
MALALSSGSPSSASRPNRRRVQRINLAAPLAGRVGGTEVSVTDLSLTGAGVTHQGPFQVGASVQLNFSWNGEKVSLPCTVLRSRLVGFSGGTEKATLYESGLLFEQVANQDVLRRMIALRIERAIEEQKANARGESLPDCRTEEMSPVRDCGYVCLRLEEDRWRRAKTRNPEQPAEGFTVRASEDPDQLDMLCSVYERCDPWMRKMIRILAKISVSEECRESHRRYVP